MKKRSIKKNTGKNFNLSTDNIIAMCFFTATLLLLVIFLVASDFFEHFEKQKAMPEGEIGELYSLSGSGSGLVSHWEFEDNYLDSVSSNNGQGINGPFFVQGKFGKAIQLDGIDDYINLPVSDNLGLINQITLSAWIKTSSSTYQGIIKRGESSSSAITSEYMLSTNSDGEVSLGCGSGNSTFTYAHSNMMVNDGTWHHIAAIVDDENNEIKIYIDGGFDDSGNIHFDIIYKNSNYQFIGTQAGTYRSFDGLIDDVRIYNRALSSSEINELYSAGSSGGGGGGGGSNPIDFVLWDIDDNGLVDNNTDGTLIMRYLFGFTGDSLIEGAIGNNAKRDTSNEIIDYLACLNTLGILDADDNGEADALSDGVLINRYMMGWTGEQLIQDAVAPDAQRTSASQIINFLNGPPGWFEGLCSETGPCVDSDGGLNYYIKGQVTGPGGGGIITENDICVNSSLLLEQHCIGDLATVRDYYCPNGCNNGRCIEGSNATTCSDTDGGINYYVKGSISGSVGSGAGYEDYCLDSIFLNERHCLGDKFNFTINYRCPYRCENGACIECTESWSCTSWSDCIDNLQTRTCTDSNNCGTTENKPSESQSCTIGQCNENWDCSYWGECKYGIKKRVCEDLNECGTFNNKPSTTKICNINYTKQCNIEWTGYVYDSEQGRCVFMRGTACENPFQYRTRTDCESSENKIIETNGSIRLRTEILVKGKEVSVEKSGERNIIKIEDEIPVSTSLEVVMDENNGKVYVKTSAGWEKEIRILPDLEYPEASDIESIEIIEDHGQAVYLIKTRKPAALLFFIPLYADIEYRINIENGKIISSKKPWWSFLAFGV